MSCWRRKRIQIRRLRCKFFPVLFYNSGAIFIPICLNTENKLQHFIIKFLQSSVFPSLGFFLIFVSGLVLLSDSPLPWAKTSCCDKLRIATVYRDRFGWKWRHSILVFIKNEVQRFFYKCCPSTSNDIPSKIPHCHVLYKCWLSDLISKSAETLHCAVWMLKQCCWSAFWHNRLLSAPSNSGEISIVQVPTPRRSKKDTALLGTASTFVCCAFLPTTAWGLKKAADRAVCAVGN